MAIWFDPTATKLSNYALVTEPLAAAAQTTANAAASAVTSEAATARAAEAAAQATANAAIGMALVFGA